MCGIIGCRTTTAAPGYLITGLKLLEYRGYDSAGIAVSAADGSTALFRTTERVDALNGLVRAWDGPALGGIGIGHTRWATHGGVCVTNAHPHQDCDRRLSVVHNGILDNAGPLRAELEGAGHSFASEVDSEVICHLVEDRLKVTRDLLTAVSQSAEQLTGSWAVVVLDGLTGRMVAAAHRSPLLVARSAEGTFLASDISAISDWVEEYRILGDGDVVEVSEDLAWTRAGIPSLAPPPIMRPPRASFSLLDQDDHMNSEIDEQPEAAARVIEGIGRSVADGTLWTGLGLPPFQRLRVIGCGTSLNAGAIIGAGLSRLGGQAHSMVVASEAAGTVIEPGTLTLAISQSGETADVLRAIDEGPEDAPVLALVNNVHSTLARKVDAVLSCSAGPEIGVAATKTFVCQVLVGTGLVIASLVASGRITRHDARSLVDDLYGIPERFAAAALAAHRELPGLVEEVRHASGFLFLGRGAAVPYAAEGALKLKELTYRWAEAYPAGELKHGPLALVETGTPVVIVDDGDPRLAGNISEVRARGGLILSVGRPGSRIETPLSALAPCGPLEAVVPLQLLALRLAVDLGFDADKPRNLAKSVTVD
ncbi:glucosamine--fructose-6-phosphate aminotransferase (isomerizing) [Cryobacterium sp. MP_M5]|uniref:glutamine--fructose-6-phosphate transaminase (isomerizing) n=1 Tax=unclassified Cryobacterium TaxID=2649013 RepID=UPI0018C8E1A4|nr:MULTISPECIES: glutamine--fructose-6-phosphate transaminase (isomerizing) [unclassified Cryobacterium]MBG6059201.1 glucosamine--fructose-6-phosphate aminotransferase (isomerizing) [Cryobacterium sp. MP_M3]MEC5177495.1 glucosamine--fructose-6-phosphate aminotransferase (isomerizing) [Cryobacterium sp. MP_M5]